MGGCSLDLLVRDVESGGEVVFESQLGTTDHSHLGQLITYAAGFDARVAVWIAREFKSEHREALDLLNRRTGEDTQFFGDEVELWKIDGSRPAPKFRLVAFPNEWRKRTATATGATAGVSPRRERYRQFFQRLMDTLREEHRGRSTDSLMRGRPNLKVGTTFRRATRGASSGRLPSDKVEKSGLGFTLTALTATGTSAYSTACTNKVRPWNPNLVNPWSGRGWTTGEPAACRPLGVVASTTAMTPWMKLGSGWLSAC